MSSSVQQVCSVDDEWERFLEEECADPAVDSDNDSESNDECEKGNKRATKGAKREKREKGDDEEGEEGGVGEQCRRSVSPLAIQSLEQALQDAQGRNVVLSHPVQYRGAVPEPSPINISTKTKVAYLCQPIDLDVFWHIPVLAYNDAREGVIKKQRLFCSNTVDELNALLVRLAPLTNYNQQINVHIDNSNKSNFAGKKRKRIEFKDTRIITVGTSKNTLLKATTKQKKAFVNCFVMELRLFYESEFREFHVKVFNSGKLKIPGIKTDDMFQQVVAATCRILQHHLQPSIPFAPSDVSDIILTNSNFKCGYYVDMQIFHDILVQKYKVHAVYDTCSSYPGIQCKFKMSAEECNLNNHELAGVERTVFNSCGKLNKKQKKDSNCITVAIFRTGSVLISGSCDNGVVFAIYQFLTRIFHEECKYICKNVYTKPNSNSTSPPSSSACATKERQDVELNNHGNGITDTFSSNAKAKMNIKKVRRMYIARTMTTSTAPLTLPLPSLSYVLMEREKESEQEKGGEEGENEPFRLLSCAGTGGSQKFPPIEQPLRFIPCN